MPLPNLPQAEYVYIIQDVENTGLCKIGRSKNPIRRMGEFGIQLPFEIAVVRFIPTTNSAKLEKWLHGHFASKRRNGEWFDLSDDDLFFVMDMESDILKSATIARFDGFNLTPIDAGYTEQRKYTSWYFEHEYYLRSKSSRHWVVVRYDVSTQSVNVFWTASNPFYMWTPRTQEDFPPTATEAKIMYRMMGQAIKLAEKIETIYKKVGES